MASIGHIAVGMAAARIGHPDRARRWTSMAWWSALSLAPDADVIGFALGVKYEDPWGHRGATHSIVFALAAASIVALAARKLRLPPLRTWFIASIVLVSHGLLDTLTDGGLGIALLWPFDLTRYFAPWRPIPVSPIGLAYFSRFGFFVGMTELILFAPLVVFALRPALASMKFASMRFVAQGFSLAPLLAVWCVAVWLIGSTDPLRERILSIVLREQTEFAPGFSDQAFKQVRTGQSSDEVRRLLGAPIDEFWDYFNQSPASATSQPGCPFVRLQSDLVVPWGPEVSPTAPALVLCAERGIRPGVSRGDVLRALGPPRGKCWGFSRSVEGRYYRNRVVCFDDDKVVEFWGGWQRGE